MLDLISNGRVDFGIGEGATRLELGGFEIPAKEKRAMALEAAEQIANMMVLDALPRLRGRRTSRCRAATSSRSRSRSRTRRCGWRAPTATRSGSRRATGSARSRSRSSIPTRRARWSAIYYDTIKSDECVPLGHTVNANLATVSAFSIHPDRAEAIRRGQDGFEFFFFAVNALVAQDARPGRSQLWESFQQLRGNRTAELDRARPRGRLPGRRHRHARRHAGASPRASRRPASIR